MRNQEVLNVPVFSNKQISTVRIPGMQMKNFNQDSQTRVVDLEEKKLLELLIRTLLK